MSGRGDIGVQRDIGNIKEINSTGLDWEGVGLLVWLIGKMLVPLWLIERKKS